MIQFPVCNLSNKDAIRSKFDTPYANHWYMNCHLLQLHWYPSFWISWPLKKCISEYKRSILSMRTSPDQFPEHLMGIWLRPVCPNDLAQTEVKQMVWSFWHQFQWPQHSQDPGWVLLQHPAASYMVFSHRKHSEVSGTLSGKSPPSHSFDPWAQLHKQF